MITREEYGWLNIYRSEGFRWIARDKNKGLYVYTTEPEKRGCEWRTTKLNSSGVFNDEGYRLFQDIKWEDEKPTKIDDLIRDYESHQAIVGERVKATVPQYVADWIEKVKGLKRNFKLEYLFDTTEMPYDVYDWLDECYGDTDILAKAWMDGFVVEKEKMYTVKLANGSILIKDPEFNTFQLCIAPKNQIEGYEYKLTQSEIESVDPRLMQFAEEVEQ